MCKMTLKKKVLKSKKNIIWKVFSDNLNQEYAHTHTKGSFK